MANEKENLEIKKKPQEVSGKEIDKVAGGNIGTYAFNKSEHAICSCGR